MRMDQTSPDARPGFALTFDDDTIQEWCALRPLFNRYGVRATFFVSCFGRLTAKDIADLHLLASEGHEIGSHSFNHVGVKRHYRSDPARVAEYEQREVVASLEAMRAAGFDPVSYAFPYGEHTPAYDAAVLRHYPHARGTAYSRALKPVAMIDSIQHRPGSGARLHNAVGVDNGYNIKPWEHFSGLLRARVMGTTILFYAHKPGQQGKYEVRPETLETIFQRAQTLGLVSRTMRELT